MAKETPRARPFWSGTISFGLVSVPVGLLAAVRPVRRPLRMMAEDGTPLRRRYVCPAEGKPVPSEKLVRGYEVEPDRFVVVEDEELEALEPAKSREIDLSRFVARDELDPALFDRPYVLTPTGDTDKAYRLLAAAMEDRDLAGLATFVMRGKEYLVAILAERGVLWAETLRFPAERRSPADVGLPKPAKPAKKQVAAMKKAIAGLGEKELDLDELVDRGTRRRDRLAEVKRCHGEGLVHVPEEAEASDGAGAAPVDLVAVLRESLRRREGGGGRKPPRRGKAPARRRARSGAGAGAKGKGDGEALSGLSRSALYSRAQELDIPGRSSMTKDELVAALRRAG